MISLPSADRMYRALLERDPEFVGVFVVGVKTTGIFCRAGCRARKPRPENCEFFSSPREALHAGYRPCLRCRPLDGAHPPPLVVRTLMKTVELQPGRRMTDEHIRGLKIDPSTARRQFLKHCGMTFHAYQRARRMGTALQGLRNGTSVARSMNGSGYQSFSGFGSAFAGIFGTPPSNACEVNCLLADWISTPLGAMVAIANDDGLCLLEFHDRRALEREIAWLRKRFKAVIVPGTNVVLKQIARELDAYFAGTLTEFKTPLMLAGSDFQLRAWTQLQRIRPGTTISYSAMAKALGRPGAQRAVGRANGENRLAIIVPCHRVIRSDGSPCGYGGGIWRKQWLLEHERRRQNDGPPQLSA